MGDVQERHDEEAYIIRRGDMVPVLSEICPCHRNKVEWLKTHRAKLGCFSCECNTWVKNNPTVEDLLKVRRRSPEGKS